MKLVVLNTWGFRRADEVLAFIEEHAGATDVFCFQELHSGGSGKTSLEALRGTYEKLSAQLTDFNAYHLGYGKDTRRESNRSVGSGEHCIGTFVNKNLPSRIVAVEQFNHLRKEWPDYNGGFSAGAMLATAVGDIVIANVHGLWQGSIKEDTEAKVEQSKIIDQMLRDIVGRKIICGDFNLLPDTEAIKIFSDSYVSLIHEHGVSDTRGPLYEKPLRHADYVFVDRNVKVEYFSVPEMSISDHLPLILEFDAQ
ncbi:MAG: hypothetical protein Q8Q18_03750 [bacterium]|nr:hypothetical protein [bacterium]